MTGRHAAAADVDDEALAATEPDRPGAHRAPVDPPASPAPKAGTPAARSSGRRRAAPPSEGRA